MENDRRLVQVIKELQSEIKKLKSENTALRVELTQSEKEVNGDKQSATDQKQKEADSLAQAALRRNVSAPVLEEQKDNIMTVRRYSVSSLPPSLRGRTHAKQNTKNKSDMETQREMNLLETSSLVELTRKEDIFTKLTTTNYMSSHHVTKRKNIQEYMQKCRYKVKTVSFLLPVEVSPYAENQGSCIQPPNKNSSHLNTILEKDL
ncbi:putative coiled-coil domain-containing protein 195 [Protopterus annectens]|uniref:putative coiled-coil domain-containing protein 195 n=1 Tax=Protopterus annectens TaxID=7888 RepID=UPI001CFA868F|nr:putative coiled-coil domain-containing protein 195 [Protopterus annectens]